MYLTNRARGENAYDTVIASPVMATPRPSTATPLPQGAMTFVGLPAPNVSTSGSELSIHVNGSARSDLAHHNVAFENGCLGEGSDDGAAFSIGEIDG